MMTEQWFGFSAFVLAAVLLSGFLTRTLIQFAHKRGMLDIPNERSSHSAPTPRGGGIAIVSTVLFATIAIGWNNRDLLLLATTSFTVALLGFLDDRYHLSAKSRLIVQFGSAFALVFFLERPALQYPFGAFGNHSTTGLLAIYLVWMTNLYNFMDGIDGMAAIQAIIVAAALSTIALIYGSTDIALVYIALSAACAGFFWYNRAPAKVFMGDVGSGFLGFFFGGLSIIGSQKTLANPMPFELTPIILAVFVSDATTTVVTRFLYGYDPTKPHREFGFHHLVRSGHTHSQISLLYGGVSLLWCAPWLFVAAQFPKVAPVVILITYLPVIWATLLLTRSGQTLIAQFAGKPETIVLGLHIPPTVPPRERTRRILRVQMYRARRGFRKAIETRATEQEQISEL